MSVMMMLEVVRIPPAPQPARARAASSAFMLGARLQANVPTVKKNRAVRQALRLPTASLSLPYCGVHAQTESRKAVPSHEAFSDALKEDDIGVNSVETTVPSSAAKKRTSQSDPMAGIKAFIDASEFPALGGGLRGSATFSPLSCASAPSRESPCSKGVRSVAALLRAV